MRDILFKLILVEEIQRNALKMNIEEFYKEMTVRKLSLQSICTGATLSRGSLPYAEKILISAGLEYEEIVKRLKSMSDYAFYLSAEKICNFLMKKADENKLECEEIFELLLTTAKSGELDKIIENPLNSDEREYGKLLMDSLILMKQKETKIH